MFCFSHLPLQDFFFVLYKSTLPSVKEISEFELPKTCFWKLFKSHWRVLTMNVFRQVFAKAEFFLSYHVGSGLCMKIPDLVKLIWQACFKLKYCQIIWGIVHMKFSSLQRGKIKDGSSYKITFWKLRWWAFSWGREHMNYILYEI